MMNSGGGTRGKQEGKAPAEGSEWRTTTQDKTSTSSNSSSCTRTTSNSSRMRRRPFSFSSLFALLTTILLGSTGGTATLLQGCDFGDELCDAGELCVPDGLFGQCYSDQESALLRPLILDRALSDTQSELLRRELTRLAVLGLDWPNARAQCVLAYFKLTVAFQLDYDTEFCTVRQPENIWALVQRVQNVLLAEEEEQAQAATEKEQEQVPEDEPESLLVGVMPEGDDNDGLEVLPVIVLEDADSQNEEEEAEARQAHKVPYELVEQVETETNNGKRRNSTDENENKDNPRVPMGAQAEKRSADGLSVEEEAELDQLVHKVLEGRSAGMRETGALNDRQLGRLVQFIRQLQGILQANAVQQAEEAAAEVMEEAEQQAEEAEAELPPLFAEDGERQAAEQQVLLLKKDSEQFDNSDMGLANTVHKIVKGGIQRVEGNRVYLKVAKENLTEEELYKLITYLDKKIAQPNNLYFDEFLYEDGQLSFRIARLGAPIVPGRKDKKDASGKEESTILENASGVAQAVYKRRKDIQTLAGVRVDETGIGSGLDVVPVERSQRDWLFAPIMAVCALTICTLVAVLAVHVARIRRRRKDSPVLPQFADRGKKTTNALYEDLCRQRIAESAQEVPQVNVTGGERSSSTSSWPDESATGPQTAAGEQMDIGTGHVILSFLQEHLDKPGQISREWESVKDYSNSAAQATIARRAENALQNVDPNVLPYDDSLVQLHDSGDASIVDISSSSAESRTSSVGYINATKICDADPEPAYIAAQAPQEGTLGAFWQMVWEQGIALLVNLCEKEETASGRCAQYWPEEGSKLYGQFEVHLVSEHIWSEHYVVRSLYLKNSATGETRTVTQFHFLTWKAGDVPASTKALLEFRRKVNKSYRGRASPVLVHCWNGAGRTGCYCLIDMVINRIQKGVKELNIAASLEHLRDQRMGMVENEEQFKCVFSCVAEEVSALLKGLQQH